MNSNRSLAITLLLALAIPVAAQEMNNTNQQLGPIVVDVNSGVPENMTNDHLAVIIRNTEMGPDGVVMSAEGTNSQAPLIPGDINRDGVVNVADVVGLLRGSVGIDYQSDIYYLLGDVSPNQAPGDDASTNVRYAVGNGVVDIADVVAALRASVGITELRFPQRAIYIETNVANTSSIPVQGIVAKFYGPYDQLVVPPDMSISPVVLNGQTGSYGIVDVNEYYAGIGWVGTNESPLRPGQSLVKISWVGPAIGFFTSWQFLNTSDQYGGELYGYPCADYQMFQFRYVTQVPGFAPDEHYSNCAKG